MANLPPLAISFAKGFATFLVVVVVGSLAIMGITSLKGGSAPTVPAKKGELLAEAKKKADDTPKSVPDPVKNIDSPKKKTTEKQPVPPIEEKKTEEKLPPVEEKKTPVEEKQTEEKKTEEKLPPVEEKKTEEKKTPVEEIPSVKDEAIPPASKFTGLLAYWTFDDGEGSLCKDQSDGKLVGTLKGNYQWIDGRRGKAVRFDGARESYFDPGTSPRLNFDFTKPFTYSLWFRATGRDGTLLSQRHANNGVPLIDLTIQNLQLVAEVRGLSKAGGDPGKIVGGAIQSNVWHHAALVRNAFKMELFLDGVSLGTKSVDVVGGVINTNLRALGAERYWLKDVPFGNPTFNGDFDEFAVFRRPLPIAEIRALAGRSK